MSTLLRAPQGEAGMAKMGRTSARIVLLLTLVGTGAFAFNMAWGSGGGFGAVAQACEGGSSSSSPSTPRSPSSSSSSSGGLPIPPLPTGSSSPKPSGSASPSSSGSPGSSPRPTSSPSPSTSSSPSGDPAPQPTPSNSGSPTTSPQLGETETCESEISIKFTRVFNDQDPRNAFVGKVVSDNENCEGARSVVVKKVKRGKDDVIGRATTNNNGKYRVFERRPRGKFYAKVRRSEATSNGGAVVDCLRDRSRTIRVR